MYVAPVERKSVLGIGTKTTMLAREQSSREGGE